jgi:hypothetical protein
MIVVIAGWKLHLPLVNNEIAKKIPKKPTNEANAIAQVLRHAKVLALVFNFGILTGSTTGLFVDSAIYTPFNYD